MSGTEEPGLSMLLAIADLQERSHAPMDVIYGQVEIAVTQATLDYIKARCKFPDAGWEGLNLGWFYGLPLVLDEALPASPGFAIRERARPTHDHIDMGSL